MLRIEKLHPLFSKPILSIVFLLVSVFFLSPAATTHAALSETSASQLVANDDVYDIKIGADGTVYWAGEFTRIGTYAGPLLKFDAQTGEWDSSFPKVTHESASPIINEIEPDGDGGWFVAGYFTHIGGIEQSYVAHINSDFSVDTDWNPVVDGTVFEVHVDGDTVYLGGSFSTVNGQARGLAASVDKEDGALTEWNPNLGPSYAMVNAMTISNGKIYLGGSFNTVNGGTSRNYLAAFPVGNSTATAWNPNPSYFINDLLSKDNVLYVAGSFTSIASNNDRDYLAAFDTTTDTLTSWDPNTNKSVGDMEFSDHDTMYITGVFETVNAQPRHEVAEINLSGTGSPTSWNPQPTAGVSFQRVSASEDTVYLSAFTNNTVTFQGEQRRILLAVSESDGTIEDWAPNLEGGGNDVLLYDSTTDSVIAGGVHYMTNGTDRNGFAAIDPATDQLTDWNLELDDAAYSLAIDGNTMYIGGDFTEIAGSDRTNIAAIDLTTKQLTAWDPKVEGTVHAIEISDHNTLYIGGWIWTVNDPPVQRNGVAEVDKTTGTATSWNPDADGQVSVIKQGNNGTVYLGGGFEYLQNWEIERYYFAEVDEVTGVPTDLNLDLDADVYDLELTDRNTIYIAGDFWELHSSTTPISREQLVEVDLSTGLPTDWAPLVNSTVNSLELYGESLFIAGWFDEVNGQSKNKIAELSTITGEVTAWNPPTSSKVETIAIGGGSLHASGFPTRFDGLGPVNTAPSTPATIQLTGVTPNGYIGTNQPSITFTITDDDEDDTVGYQIQIDNDPDFSSPEVDYESGTNLPQGETTFTVGQPAGGGTYHEGSEDQTLPDDEYYIQIKTTDENGGESEYTPVNGGDPAFTVDDTPPTTPEAPTNESDENDTTPTITWPPSEDDGSGLPEEDAYTIIWCDNPDFEGCSGNTDTTDTNEYTFEDPLPDGTWYIEIIANDDVGNESDHSPTLTITITSGSDAGSGSGSGSSGKSKSSSRSSKRSSDSCSLPVPIGTPNLFEIRVTNTTAQLFFAPQAGIHDYMISYGHHDNAEGFGTWLVGSDSGVNNITVEALEPGQSYVFKVRGQRGCAPGEWSNTMRVTTLRKPGGVRYHYAFMPMVKEVLKQNTFKPVTQTLATTQSALMDAVEPVIESVKPSNSPAPTPAFSSPAPATQPQPQPENKPWWQKLFSWFQ